MGTAPLGVRTKIPDLMNHQSERLSQLEQAAPFLVGLDAIRLIHSSQRKAANENHE